jgi:hypothetical protein
VETRSLPWRSSVPRPQFYLARGAFLILFLFVLFADLLEPAVTFLERHSLRVAGIAAGPSHRCI